MMVIDEESGFFILCPHLHVKLLLTQILVSCFTFLLVIINVPSDTCMFVTRGVSPIATKKAPRFCTYQKKFLSFLVVTSFRLEICD